MHACINQFQWFVAYVPTYYIFKGKGGYFKLYSTIVKYTPLANKFKCTNNKYVYARGRR